MTARLREYWRRILTVLHIRRIEDHADAEFAAHRKKAVGAHQHEGVSLHGLESLLKDIVQGLRVMRANPRFTLAAILMLGLSIGANTTVVTLVNATLFKGYPQVERNDRLLYLTLYPDCCVSYPMFEDWRSMARSFQGMAAVHDSRRTFSDGDRDDSPRTYYATEITANTFRLVGRQPVLGRDFTHADELPGAAPVAILSYRLWDQRYDRNPAVLGRTVRLNGQATTVIGIMPEGFSFPQNQDIWVPMVPTAALRDRSHVVIWYILGRLADGVSAESARAEMQAIGRRLSTEYPRTDNALPLVRTFPEFFIRSDSIRVYQAMLVAVSFLLLIACANLANLLLGRSIDRSRELSVRLALGASRWRITRLLLVESVLLSAPGGVLGWAIARFGIRVYARFADGAGLSSWTGIWFANIIDYSMDTRVFIYLVAISLGTGLLFGLAPALRLSRLDINRTLKDGGRGATGGSRRNRLATLLVMGETALTVMLLAGSGVMIRSLLKIYTAELGFNPSRELMMALLLPQSYTAPEMISFADRLKARLEALPGVESVAIANTRPYLPVRNLAFEVEDAPSASTGEGDESRPKTSWTITTPDYFRSLGLSMIAGRDFYDTDTGTGNPVVIVNRQFAAAVWPHQNAIGKHLRFFERNVAGPWLTVVGIAPNIAQSEFSHPLYRFLPEVYVPYSQRPSNVISVQALTRVGSEPLANAFYREVHALDPDLPLVFPPQSMAENLGQTYRYQGTVSLLFLIFAAIALLLASAGLYSVVAHSVRRRTQEIGVRIALGATVARILGLVSSEAIVPVGAGLAAGLAASLAVNRVLDTFIVGISPSDPIALVGTTVVLILCAALGCLIPAARAARIDPAQAIRHE